jgi:hypothetical protein
MPPKLKRAAVMAFAAASRSAVRSTTATARCELEESSCVVRLEVVEEVDVWSTRVDEERMAASVIVLVMQKTLGSRALGRIWRRRASRFRRLS